MLLMYINTGLGSDLGEPSGSWLKIMTVGEFVRYDFQTCARRFLRNYQAKFNYVIHNTSTLDVVDVHYHKFRI